MSREKQPFPFDAEASAVMNTFMRDAGERFRLAQESYVSNQNVHGFSHGRAWQSHHSYDPDRVDQMKTISHKTELNISDIVLGRLDVIERMLAEITDSMAQSFAASFYQMISDTCEEHGSVVAAGGSLGEQLLQALESIEFTVDRYGNVSLPEFRVGSAMAERMKSDDSLNSPEFQARAAAIRASKSAQALEKEAARKAKFRKGDE